MKSVDRRRLLHAYSGSGRRARIHTSVRWASAPIERVVALVPPDGEILDFGCGHGLFSLAAAIDAPHRTFHAVDIDRAKLLIARAAAARLGVSDRIHFEVVDAKWRPEPARYDAAVTNDVLYLMGAQTAEQTIRSLLASVRPQGVVVIKEIGETPRIKHLVNEVQERISTRVLGITEGATVDVLDEAVILRALASPDRDIERVAMDAGYLHAHVAFVSRPRP